MKAAIIGGGVIGAGWAARFALMGWNVAVFDPAEGAEAQVLATLAAARAALPGLHDVPLPTEGAIRFSAGLSEAVEGADWVQESTPERLDLKRKILQSVQAACPEGAIIGSSTSGFTASELQGCATRPEQIVVAHPFNPVYLLPLVELGGSGVNDPDLMARAEGMLRSIGMFPLRLRAEVPAHIADRLLEAVWREALWLIKDGAATTTEIDEAIRMGFGLRWAQQGLFETYRIAGGAAGMAHFLAQFGPALKWPWTKLMDVPDLDEALVQTIADQSDDQAAGRSITDLATARDENLVAILRGLKLQGQPGPGAHLTAVDAALAPPAPDITAPFVSKAMVVPLNWADYNGHMTEARYLEAFGYATDRVMELLGCDAAYVADGNSFFTVETHIRHLDEVRCGAPIEITTHCLEGAGKKMHLFHVMRSEGRVLATGEHLQLHVDLTTRRAAPPLEPVASRLVAMAEGHARFTPPEGAGRAVGQAPE